MVSGVLGPDYRFSTPARSASRTSSATDRRLSLDVVWLQWNVTVRSTVPRSAAMTVSTTGAEGLGPSCPITVAG